MTAAGNSASTPIIPGFHPDPTVCRVGDDYYLATSSFEYFPGAPIFHSRDLLTWTQIGNILTTRDHVTDGRRPSGGIWAGTLRHHDGHFYFITTDTYDLEAGHFIVTAKDPAGPWSAPVHLPEAIGIDPDIAWDDDGTCLVTWHKFDWRLGGQSVLQARVNPSTGEFLGEPYEVWQGSGLPAAEGPHLYHIGEWWYLLLAEGGTEKGHCVTAARARRPEGPYDDCPSNPILTSRSTFSTVQCTGHADLVTTPDGGWAAVYLGNRPQGPTPGFHVLGRESFIAGIDWVDEWPVFARDRFEVPACDTGFHERFEQETLGPRWVVPSGELDELVRPVGGGVVVPPGMRLSVRVRDLRWTAAAAVRSGSFSLRIDSRHAFGVTVRDGRAEAWAVIGGLRQALGVCAVADDGAILTIEAVDPDGPAVPRGDAGPDQIVVSASSGGTTSKLGRLDGRYVSTEVAAGFTGRVLALGDETAATHAQEFTYSPR